MIVSMRWRRRIERWAVALLLAATIGISGSGDFDAAAAELGMRAAEAKSAAQAKELSSRDKETAVWAERLEAIAMELRRVQPAGARRATLTEALEATGDDAPLALAARVLRASDALSGFEAGTVAQWRDEAAEQRGIGVPESVVARQPELTAEVAGRFAEFRSRIEPLRAASQSADSNAAAAALVELADWWSGFATARGWRAIEKQALPIQFAESTSARTPAADDGPMPLGASPSPTNPTPADLAETLEVRFTPQVQAIAQQLGNQPIAIRSWVYDNIEFDPTFGSIQGAELTLLNRRGNAFDIASLTLALLRSAGVPSRYVRGTIELPIERVQNWLGDVGTPQIALDLMQKGGIPVSAVIVGGRLAAVRFEHVWIEAWVDFIPSRGAINRVPDQWVPLDVAYKQYDYIPAVPWRAAVVQPRREVIADFAEGIRVDATGGISGFDFDVLSDGLRTIAEDLGDDLVAADPDIEGTAFYDRRTIQPIDSLILEGTLPFPLRSTNVQRFSEVPASSRHTVRIRFFATDSALRLDSPSQDVVLPTVRLGTKRLAMDYPGATAADQQALAAIAQSHAASMSLGQIRVATRLVLGEEQLFDAGVVRMGEPHFWRVDLRDTFGNVTTTEAYRFAAGSQVVFVANLAGVRADRVEREAVGLPPRAALPVRDFLYYGAQVFWGMSDHLADQAARGVGGRYLRLPSMGAFAQQLSVRYFFGVPRTASIGGFVTDVKASRAGISLADARDTEQLAIRLGAGNSMAESTAWSMLSGTGQYDLGISTATLIKTAIDRGQRLFQIDASNVNTALAQLQLSVDAENEIRQTVNAGLIVVAHEREITARGWSGAGYVIFDRNTGSSVQRIEGGFAGGLNLPCIFAAVSLLILCESRVLAAFTRLMGGLVARQGARLIAGMGLAAIFAAIAPGAGLVLAILNVVIIAVTIAMAVAEVARWVRGVIDGFEQLTPEELAELGINTINDIACSYVPPCLPGILGGFFGGGGGGGDGGGGPEDGGSGGPTAGNPVAIGTGAKWQNETDYAADGVFPLSFRRTYLSAAPRVNSRIGSKWTAQYFQSLRLPPDLSGGPFPTDRNPEGVLLLRPDGAWYQFNRRDDVFIADDTVPGRLERLVSSGNTSGWRYTPVTDEVETYDPQGRLLSITNRAGLAHTLRYELASGRLIEVTDSYGRRLRFGYDTDTGYLASMTDALDRVVNYRHDEAGNLIEARYPDTRLRRYHYEDLSHRYHLTGITDERDIRVATWTYDHLGRTKEYQRAGDVDRHRFRYGNDRTTVIDPLDTERTYEYVRRGDLLYPARITEPCASCGSGSVAQTTYDSRGLIATRRDFRDNVTAYQRNGRGLITSMVEAQGTAQARTTTTEWDTRFSLPTRVVEPIQGGTRITVYTYDDEGNPTRRAISVGAVTRTWTYTWNAAGQMLTEDGPRTDVTDVTTMSYRSDGFLATRTDAAGNQWRYEDYNADGQVTRMVDPNGLVTQYRYDERRRLIETIEDDESTVYRYDAAGQLTRITLPDASFIEYTYDPAGRLTGLRDALNHRVSYTLDGMGNRIREDTYDPANQLAQTASRIYDAVGRLEQAIGADNQITRWEYDGNGNERAMVDPREQRTESIYDALDRLTLTTDPDDGEIAYTYDAQDNLRSVTDPRDLVTSYTYNGFDELTRLDSPDTGQTDHTYDPSGNLLTRRDARGVLSTHRYDALDRLTQISYPAFAGQPAETLGFTYDDTAAGNAGRSRLTEVTDASGSTAYTYDVHGRVTAKTQTVGTGANVSTRTLATSYEANGRIEGHVLPSGAEIRYTYRADGRVLSITVNGVEIVREIDYHPMGEVRGWRYNASDRYQRTYDRDGRVASHSAGAESRTIAFDPASRITAISDGAGGANQWTYEYDDLDRLTTAQNPAATGPVAGLNLGWEYDPTGNRTRETRNGNAPVPYTIPSTSNRLTQVGTQARQYDAVGNTINDGNGLSSVYSARNRLVQTTRGGASTTYEYNAFGERVCKASNASDCVAAPPTARTEYVYTDDGQLIGDYPPTTTDGYEVVWLDTTPVAVLKRRPGSTNGGPTGGGNATAWLGQAAGGVEVFFVHPDHLDTPRIIVNAGNQTVWRWDSAPFGDTAANGRPTPAIAADFRFNLRFPGQQLDAETGTHYNYFRDYEPATGRYVQSDPIGLQGGINTFTYAESNSLGLFDAQGLFGSGRAGQQNKRRGKGYESVWRCFLQKHCKQVIEQAYVRVRGFSRGRFFDFLCRNDGVDDVYYEIKTGESYTARQERKNSQLRSDGFKIRKIIKCRSC